MISDRSRPRITAKSPNRPPSVLFSGLVEALYPTRCAACDLPGSLLCSGCAGHLVLIDAGQACFRCGAPGGVASCDECEGVDFAFSSAVCAGLLEWPLSRLVTLYKDGGERRLSAVLANILTGPVARQRTLVEAIVPVPASQSSLSKRGFDHTARLADTVAATSGLPVVRALSHLGGRDQRTLDRPQRFANAASLFARTSSAISSRVLLLDDVLTTGATLDAAARVLLRGGAAEVHAVTVARACDLHPRSTHSARDNLGRLPLGSVVAGEEP